jgi:hypothetical protein
VLPPGGGGIFIPPSEGGDVVSLPGNGFLLGPNFRLIVLFLGPEIGISIPFHPKLVHLYL